MVEEPRVIPSFYINVGPVVSAVKIFEQPDDKNSPPWIISGDVDGNIKVWNSHTRRLHQAVSEEGNSAVLWLDVFKADGCDYLTVQRRFSCTVSTFKLQAAKWEQSSELSLKEPHNGFCTGDVSSYHLMVPQGEHSFELFKFANESWTNVASHSSHADGNVTALRLAPNADCMMALAGYESGAIFILKIAEDTFEVLHKLEMKHDGEAPSILSLDYDAHKDLGVAATSEDFIVSFDLDGNVQKKRELPSKGVSQIRIRKQDSKLLAGASWDSTLRLFSWLKPNKLKPLGALRFHQEGLTCVDCSGYTGWITCGGKDGKLTVWKDLYTD